MYIIYANGKIYSPNIKSLHTGDMSGICYPYVGYICVKVKIVDIFYWT